MLVKIRIRKGKLFGVSRGVFSKVRFNNTCINNNRYEEGNKMQNETETIHAVENNV